MALKKLFSKCLFAAAGLSLAATGCVTEYGKPEASWWTSIDTEKDAERQTIQLKHPGRMHLIAGQVAEKRKLHADARKHYAAALKEEPKNVDAIIGIARLDQHSGRMGDAANGFDRAMKLAPNDDNVLDAAGMFYAAQGRWQQATALLQRAVSAKPNHKDHRFHYGVVLAKSGNFSAAHQQFVVAVGKPMAHYHIGYMLYEQGQNEAAARQFQLALSMQPDLEAPRAMLAKLGYTRRRTEQVANNDRQPMRRPVRSVNHVEQSRDLGTQSAWGHRAAPQQPSNHSHGSNDGPVILPGPRQPSQAAPRGPVARPNFATQQSNQGIVIPPPYRGNVQ